MTRKDDLENSVRESTDIIKQYEEILRTSDRPEEKRRAERVIAEQWGHTERYLGEYQALLEGVWPEELAQVARALAAWQAEDKSISVELPDVPCPYRGLEPFEAEHAKFYFGRETMVERLVSDIEANNFVAVVGPSGCGKSSLARARLAQSLAPGGGAWKLHTFSPHADPLYELSTWLVELLEPEMDSIDRMAQARKLADHLSSGTLSMAEVVARLRDRHLALPSLVLIADQFEELYTECQDEKRRERFIEALLAASTQGIHVVLTRTPTFSGACCHIFSWARPWIQGSPTYCP